MLVESNVSGSKNQMKTHVTIKNWKARYTHWFSHGLNLSICKICKIQCVSNKVERKNNYNIFSIFRIPDNFCCENA